MKFKILVQRAGGEKCDVTGKKYGFSSHVRIDSKYRKKVFRRCDTAKACS